MENLEKLLGTLQKQSFTLNYGDNKAEINLDILLSDYDDGISFIDYISDFYYVQSVYQKLKNNKGADPVEIFQYFSKSSESYYKLLSLIKFFYSELKKCLYEIKDGTKFRRRIHFEIYKELLYTSYSYIKIVWIPYLDKEDNDIDVTIYSESNLEEKNKILTYFIKQYDVGLNPILKLTLLRIILELLINDRENFKLRKQSLEKFLESFSDKLINLTSKFQSTLDRHVSNQVLCLVSVDNNNWFGQMINNVEFSNALNTLTGKNRRNLNCYAVAYNDSLDYYSYSINHLDLDDRNDLHNIFSELLNKVPAAKLTDDVRYFLPNENDSIKYGQFKNFPEKSNGKFNRMFTCCERKLFAKLRKEESKINKMNILVTQAPCVYCSRELNYIKKKGSMTIDINYPELDRINTHDCLAQKIFDSYSNLIPISSRILIWIKQKFKFNLK